MPKDKYVPVRMDEELHAQVETEAKKTDTSLSETIRAILRGFFRKGGQK